MSRRGRILFVDAYDSFSNNIIGLLQQNLAVDVKVVHIDDEAANRDLGHVLEGVDAIVVGPGPGNPANPTDVGFINRIWNLPEERLLPVLGVCLGFQCLGLHFGGNVSQLSSPRHGLVTNVSHAGLGIFDQVGDLRVTQYHSLRIGLGKEASSLQATAWDDSDDTNGPILMGLQHTELPFYGIQFHPESICSSAEGPKIVRNWWSQAQEWLQTHRGRHFSTSHPIDGGGETLLSPDVNANAENGCAVTNSVLAREIQKLSGISPPCLQWTRLASTTLDVVGICEGMGWSNQDVVILDPQGHRTGRYSVIGVVEPGKTVQVNYRSWDHTMSFWSCSKDKHELALDSIDQVWPMLQESLDMQNPRGSSREVSHHQHHSQTSGLVDCPTHCPFWGGFMGYFSYEAGLETIKVDLHESCEESQAPDINLTFVYRSIVIDHQESQTYVQSLLADDHAWIVHVCEKIEGDTRPYSPADLPMSKRRRVCDNGVPVLGSHVEDDSLPNSPADSDFERPPSKRRRVYDAGIALEDALDEAVIKSPIGEEYRARVLECQRHLRKGDSYELCLTDQTEVQLTRDSAISQDAISWAVYKKLRRLNAAPFGAFLRLSNVTVASSSPERFCHWSRSTHCQFRPMKGTVKKTPDMTRDKANEILNNSKERAENLMIVDLIRHDLGGVIGASNVSVPKLMEVEEYETVFQLVSVIEGSPSAHVTQPRGLDVLAVSLPPGSMTGAPKKRSCEILRGIEKRPRGVYSGVLGYLDVGGGGDFSVVIRTATTVQQTKSKEQTWFIGAGGAVTIQSTAEGEFNEMETKVQSALRAFYCSNAHR